MTDLLEILKRYEALPPSAVVSPKATAAILGLSERVVRYHPSLPRVQLARGRYGFRKSDIENLSSGGFRPIGNAAAEVVRKLKTRVKETGNGQIRRR